MKKQIKFNITKLNKTTEETKPEMPAGPKFCPNCGTPTNGSKFCPNCGTKLL